jgi:heme exporter protein A
VTVCVSLSPALELEGVAKLYGRTAALRSTSLRLLPGETLALLGPNGSGKTTLLKIVAGAITPSLGRGSIFGRDMLAERPAVRPQVCLLASESYLYEDLTAIENLAFILTMAGRRAPREELCRTLREVGLEGRAGERVSSFSSGMKRRLGLARLLLFQPKLLLLDEPYNNLDEGGAELVDALVRRASSEGRATILATHDAARALALADLVAVLQRGALSYLGAASAYRGSYANHVG